MARGRLRKTCKCKICGEDLAIGNEAFRPLRDSRKAHLGRWERVCVQCALEWAEANAETARAFYV